MAFFDFIKTTQATVTKVLRFGPNSKITVQGDDRAEYDIDLNELRNVLDNASRVKTIVASETLTAADSGKTIMMSEVGGNALVELVLPVATGSGNKFRFVVGVVNTSNYVIEVADATDLMYGNIITNSTGDTPDLAQPWPTAADSDTITLNGTTTGGAAIGDYVELEDVATNTWIVNGVTTSSGAEATPFSAAVS